MKNLSEFQIIGHVGAVKTVGSTVRVTIAANYPYRDDNGDRQEVVYWNEITIFSDNTKRFVKQYVGKGDLVHARGRIGQNSYERDGDRVYTVDLIANSFGLLASKNQAGDADHEDQSDHGDQGDDGRGPEPEPEPQTTKTRTTRKRAA